MNLKNDNNIGTTSKYLNENNTDVFLQDQLNLFREVREGNKTWKDLNNLRQEYGFPFVNIDSLRRSFGALSLYDDAGWISRGTSGTVAATNREMVETNFTTGTTTSDKVISLLPDEISKADVLLKAHGFNPDEFELISAKNSKWEQGSKEGIRTLYSSKISVKPRSGIKPFLKDICEHFENYRPKVDLEYDYFDWFESNECLVLPLVDFHWGRLPDMEHAENFNLSQIKEMLMENMRTYIRKFANRRFHKIYLVVGQDYFNSSFTGYTSSQTHLQSNATDVRTMYTTGTELLIDIVDLFIQSELCSHVQIVGSLGNHDTSEEFWLFKLLKAYYRNTKMVSVDDSCKPRKYLDLGAACVGVGHLDKEKDKAFGLMQCEVPELWAKAKTRMFIAGHLHHLSVESKQGVEIWRIPSPALPDRWTVESGFVQNQPKTMAFIFDYNEGLIENHYVNI
jgi:hypothetical protein